MRIIYEDSEGTKQIIPSPHYKGTIEELAIKRVPKGLDYKIIDESELPDRTFRNAWGLEGGKVVEKVDKAKEIKKDELRVERKPLLESLDVAFMTAIEKGEDYTDVIIEKEKLRDITKLVDECETIDDIKAVKI